MQRSSTAPLKAIRMVGHFPADSVHAHFNQYQSFQARSTHGTEGSALQCIHVSHLCFAVHNSPSFVPRVLCLCAVHLHVGLGLRSLLLFVSQVLRCL